MKKQCNEPLIPPQDITQCQPENKKPKNETPSLPKKLQAYNESKALNSKILCIALPVLSILWVLSRSGLSIANFLSYNINNPIPQFDPKNDALASMSSEISKLPEGSEKTILRLAYDASIKAQNNTLLLKNIGYFPELSQQEIKDKLQQLNQTLKSERLETLKTQQYLSQISSKLEIQDWKEVEKDLRSLMREIRIVDINELFRLVAKANNAAESIINRDIIIFLGLTGAGKTTTIHFLAGSKMIVTTENGMFHIAPKDINNPALKNAVTSSSAVSQTRYITPVPVEFIGSDRRSRESVILCDSPGSGDSAGAEVDIANAIGVATAIQNAKSLKIVVLISYKSIGNRLEGLKELLHTLAGSIPDIKNYIQAFTYFFTRYPNEEKGQIRATFQNIKDTMSPEEKADMNFVGLLDDILRKISTKDPIVIDPVNDDPESLLRMLQDSPGIYNPHRAFQSMITKTSEMKLQEQIIRHKTSIVAAMDRFDYALAKYKMDELQRLYKALGNDFIHKAYNECIDYCTKKLNGVFQAAMQNLNRYMRESGTLRQENVDEYAQYMTHAKNAESLREAHLADSVLGSSRLGQNIVEQAQTLLNELKKYGPTHPSVNTILEKLKLVSSQFSEVGPSYQDGCKIIIDKLEVLEKDFRNWVLTDYFDGSATRMKVVNESIKILKDHSEHIPSQRIFDRLKENFMESLNNCTEGPTAVFNKDVLENEDITVLEKCTRRIQKAENSASLKPYFEAKEFTQAYELLLGKLLRYSQDIYSKMPIYFAKVDSMPSQNDYVGWKDLQKQMQETRTQIDAILFLASEQIARIKKL